MSNLKIMMAAALGAVLPCTSSVSAQGRDIDAASEIRFGSGMQSIAGTEDFPDLKLAGKIPGTDVFSNLKLAGKQSGIEELAQLPLARVYLEANGFSKSTPFAISWTDSPIIASPGNFGIEAGFRQASAAMTLGTNGTPLRQASAFIPTGNTLPSIRNASASSASPTTPVSPARPPFAASGGQAPSGNGVVKGSPSGGGFVLFDPVPGYSSRPGAAYTLYLNFNGFDFTGTWGNTGKSPGLVPAYTVDTDPTTFTATELANIKNVWSRVAEKYVAFNVNVTTVDPAVAAGQAGSDATRQAYYDSTARLMHTVIGGLDDWYGSAGGVSFLGVAKNTYSTTANSGASAGYHTNWVFPNSSATNLQYLGEASAHENGHALGLSHQSRWTGTPLALTSQYDTGSGTGANSFAPIMGNSYSAQRGTWRYGATNSNSSTTAQNDVAVLLSNPGISVGAAGLVDSGIGHTLGTATALPMTGNAIITTAAAGHIAPAVAPAAPIGAANYTTDFFAFTAGGSGGADGSVVAVSLRSGRQEITAGSADPGATLNATLRLLDAAGNTIITANSGALVETINSGFLPAGTYYFQVSSDGGQTNNGYTYYDMGSYFLSGSITPVPEPAEMLLIAAVGFWVMRVRRRTLVRDAAS